MRQSDGYLAESPVVTERRTCGTNVPVFSHVWYTVVTRQSQENEEPEMGKQLGHL